MFNEISLFFKTKLIEELDSSIIMLCIWILSNFIIFFYSFVLFVSYLFVLLKTKFKLYKNESGNIFIYYKGGNE
jgi:hypothetical protein